MKRTIISLVLFVLLSVSCLAVEVPFIEDDGEVDTRGWLNSAQTPRYKSIDVNETAMGDGTLSIYFRCYVEDPWLLDFESCGTTTFYVNDNLVHTISNDYDYPWDWEWINISVSQAYFVVGTNNISIGRQDAGITPEIGIDEDNNYGHSWFDYERDIGTAFPIISQGTEIVAGEHMIRLYVENGAAMSMSKAIKKLNKYGGADEVRKQAKRARKVLKRLLKQK